MSVVAEELRVEDNVDFTHDARTPNMFVQLRNRNAQRVPFRAEHLQPIEEEGHVTSGTSVGGIGFNGSNCRLLKTARV